MSWRTRIWGLGLLAIVVSVACMTGSSAPTLASDDSGLQMEGSARAETVEAYELAFSTYLGGSGGEMSRDIFVDDQGYIYVTGGTQSDDFVTTPGAYDRTFDQSGTLIGSDGYMDAFVTKIAPDGSLVWSTYLGGGNYDRAYAIEVDAQGYVYVAGRAGPGFPTTPGAFQPDFQGHDQGRYGMENGFVAELAPDGSALLWASYVGVGWMCRDLAIDGNGDLYVSMQYIGVGPTPPAAWFANAYQPSPRGDLEAGLVKIAGDGSRVHWATWVGGSGRDYADASVRVGAPGEAYIVLSTESTDLPTTPGAHDGTFNGGVDYYVARFSADGSSLLFGTYLGGSGEEWMSTHDLALDDQGNAYAAALTTSSDFPTTPGAFQRVPGGAADGVVAKLSPTGAMLHSTYLGGGGHENLDGIYVDAAGNVFVTGETGSADFPVSATAYQSTFGGRRDAILVRLAADFSELLYSTYMGGGAYDTGSSSFLGQDGSLYLAGMTDGAGWPTRNAFQSSFAGGGGEWGVGDAVLAKFTLSTRPVAPASVGISGPATGFVGVGYSFTATVSPVTATLPITYVWQATGQSPVTHTGDLSDTVVFTWDVAGAQTITGTATNAGGTVTDTHTIAVSPAPPTGVVIAGPTVGLVAVAHSFTDTVSPDTAMVPVTHAWRATGQSPVTNTGGLSDTVTFTWGTTGTQTITVTAVNAGGAAIGTHAILIVVTPPPPTGVSIDGPTTGFIGVAHSFTATVSPGTAMVPMTYTWRASGQSPVTNTGGLSDVISFTWATTGTQAITVTATNGGGAVSDTHAIAIAVPPPPTGVTISGPTTGVDGIPYAFAATVSPDTAALPTTFNWQATEQGPVTHTSGLNDTVTFAWDLTGTKTITVTATNAGGAVAGTHRIIISPGYKLYLPLILRSWS